LILNFRYRLYPSRTQAAVLDSMLGAFCDLYNAALQQRIEAYRRRGISLRYANQASELKAVREVDERLRGYSFSAEQQVLRRLDKAFLAFFRRLKNRANAGFPRFQAKARFDSAEFPVGDGLTIRKSKRIGIVGVPSEIKCKWHRPIPADAKLRGAVIKRKAGKWYVCFWVKIPSMEAPERAFVPIGIDMGLTSLVALSTGEIVATPQHTARAAKALRRAQRAVARKRCHSRRQRKAKLRVARLHCRVGNQRRDFSHKLSRYLVDRFSHIAMEDLNIVGLARGMLAKSVHNAAWAQLVQHVRYKAESAGVEVRLVNPRRTSQTCPECGVITPKTLADRVHRCDCGCVLDRDVAAARVVLHLAGFSPGTGLQAQSVRDAA
jgi:putative transposase